MRSAFLSCLLAAFVAAHPVAAQYAQQPVSPQTTVSNEDFRRLALISESFDYESSRLALTQSSRHSIRRYAASLMSHYRFDYARLAAGAGIFSGIPALPADPNMAPAPVSDTRRAAMLNQLATVTGRAFDRLYADMQVGTRQETLGLYQAYVQSGGDPALVTFARERIPFLQQQYRAARRFTGR